MDSITCHIHIDAGHDLCWTYFPFEMKMTNVLVLTENSEILFWYHLWEMFPRTWFNQKYQTKML